MKVSVITPVYNNKSYIRSCLESVAAQTWPDIEHIVIDGGSTDGTVDIIKRYRDAIAYWVSEPDRGIYDAMNKGLRRATGSIVGILNSDDFYAGQFVIQNVADAFKATRADACYGDLVYVDRADTGKVVRYWQSGQFRRERFRLGWMPPHPAFFVRREVYERSGLFDLSFPLAADYELMLRFLYKNNESAAYIPKVLVKMRTGGASKSWWYTARAIIENYRAWRVNGLSANPCTFVMKPLSKTLQFLNRKPLAQ